MLFRDEGEFEKANAHTEQLKFHAANDAYKLGSRDGYAGQCLVSAF
jgi:hypothetical protein